jgi:hypothetical protein
MKIEVDIIEDEVDFDGRFVEGLIIICRKCGHAVHVAGRSSSSARRAAADMRSECPEQLNNFYDAGWWS